MGQDEYTDATLLVHGQHKFTALVRVPPKYLLNIYKRKDKSDPKLFAYVEKNLEKIKARAEGQEPVPELKLPCEKITFPDQKSAKAELQRIRALDQKHKIPTRSYPCKKCSGWHLTSLALEEWEEKEEIFTSLEQHKQAQKGEAVPLAQTEKPARAITPLPENYREDRRFKIGIITLSGILCGPRLYPYRKIFESPEGKTVNVSYSSTKPIVIKNYLHHRVICKTNRKKQARTLGLIDENNNVINLDSP